MFDGGDTLLSDFTYTVRSDGKRTAVTENIFDGTTTRTQAFAWAYDNLGRLTSETLVASHLDDYVDTFTFDLAGNRVQYVHDSANDADDKSVTYEYDNNDRLLTETVDANGSAGDRHTVYSYDETQQTGKTVHLGLSDRGAVQEQTTNTYNLQGRLSKVEIDQDVATNPGIDTTTEYEYDESGFRILKDVDGTITKYLADENNHTGYTQVLEEKNSSNAVVKTFLLGHDVLALHDGTHGQVHLLYDGHGSTRQVVNTSGAVITANSIAQVFIYNAYGEALGFEESQAITTLLYSGEWFEVTIDRQYLRARFYNPVTGAFNRLDDFSGDLQDPITIHKYLYAGADPILYADPSGRTRFIDLIATGQPTLSPSSYEFVDPSELIDTILLEREIALNYVRTTITSGIKLSAAASRYATNMLGFIMDYVAFDDPVQLALGWVGANACFPAGTKVVVSMDEQGCTLTRNIEELQEGDVVLSRSEHDPTGELTRRRIVKTRQLTKDQLYRLSLEDSDGNVGSVRATAEHPFYVPQRGWMPAAALAQGERILDLQGQQLTVLRTAREPDGTSVQVYNMEVEEDHTYFITDVEGNLCNAIWVHNACRFQAIEDVFRRVAKVVAIVDPVDLFTGTVTNKTVRSFVRQVGNALDDAGHLIGKALGGSGRSLQNIVAQNRAVNRGAFRVFEQKIAKYIKENQVSALLKVVPRYIGDSARPSQVDYFVEFSDGVKWDVHKFRNP